MQSIRQKEGVLPSVLQALLQKVHWIQTLKGASKPVFYQLSRCHQQDCVQSQVHLHAEKVKDHFLLVLAVNDIVVGFDEPEHLYEDENHQELEDRVLDESHGVAAKTEIELEVDAETDHVH